MGCAGREARAERLDTNNVAHSLDGYGLDRFKGDLLLFLPHISIDCVTILVKPRIRNLIFGI